MNYLFEEGFEVDNSEWIPQDLMEIGVHHPATRD